MFKRELSKRELLFFVVLILFCIGRCIYKCFPDNDLWARLLVGSSIIDGFTIIKQDIFSYFPTHIWYDHEWGASVFIYGFFKLFHEYGLLLLKCILVLGVALLTFGTINLREPKHASPFNILPYVFSMMAGFYVFGGTVRCHLFTFFFFTLFIYILENVRLKGFKHWWVMPLIMLFWSNIHGGCVSGIGLLVMYAIGEKLNGKPIGFYVKALIASCLVTFINPWGIGYVMFLLKATTMSREIILEWRGSFEQAGIKHYLFFKLYFFFMCFIGLCTFIKKLIHKEQLDKTKIILLLSTMYLSVAHIKHQPFFTITWLIFLYDDIYYVLGDFFHKILNKIPDMNENKINKLVLFKEGFAYFFVIWFTLICYTSYTRPISITTTAYPYYAIEFIKLNDLKGKLFINFDWGSYAEYKLFPHCKISLDGRFEEAFDPNLIYEMQYFHLLKNDKWYGIIEKYPPDIMVIEKKYPVYNEILKKPEWKLVFDNNLSGVFLSENLQKDKYIYPPTDADYYERTKFDKNFQFLRNNRRQN